MSIASGVKPVTLSNGLTVLLKEIHTSPIVTVWVWYRVGSRNEKEGITGCSHWVEHMLFKGGQRFKKGEIFQQVARAGGYNNGFTSHDMTVYFETLPADRLELGLDIEADRMANALFDPEEVASERTVIISEREGAENSPQFLLGEELSAAAFRVHPYRLPVVGYKCDLEQMTREELYNYYRTFYGPNNAILVVTGDFAGEQALAKVEQYFGPIAAQVSPPRLRAVEPPQQGERRLVLRRPGTAAYLQAGFHVPAVGHDDIYPLVLLDAILSGAKPLTFHGGAWMGRSSRLHRALVDGNLASTVGSDLPLSVDPTHFSFWATARTGVAPERVEEAFLAELAKIAGEPPSLQELEKALRQTRAQFAYGSDGVSAQAFSLGYFSLISSHEYLDTFLDKLAQVTPEEVQRAAATYLAPDNRTLGWFLPTGEPVGGESGAPPNAFHFMPFTGLAGAGEGPTLAAERFPLSSGGILLVSPNRNTPTVAMRASLSAGSIRESDAQAGLAHLTSSSVMRGTTRHTYREIADAVESVGASLHFGSSLENAYSGAKCLAGDAAFLLKMMAECWREPVFPAEEVEKVRSEVLTAIREQKDDTRTVAEHTFRRLLYPPEHPYGRNNIGEEETVAALGREEVVAFHRRAFDPRSLILVIVGDVEPEAVREAAEKALGDWRNGALPEPVIPPLPVRAARQRALAPMMHKSQADIVLGFPALERRSSDYHAADLACSIVGRFGLMGRLGKSVRDEQGLAYYVFARLQAWKYGGHWVTQAGVNPKNVVQARESIWRELRKLASEPVSQEELREVQSSQIGSLALRLETNDGIAAVLHEIEYHRLGSDYLQRLPGIIRGLSREQLLEVSRRYLAPETAVEVIAGPYQG